MEFLYKILHTMFKIKHFIKYVGNYSIVYRVSYLDENGRGWSDTRPWWVSRRFTNYKDAKTQKKAMQLAGCKDVKIASGLN